MYRRIITIYLLIKQKMCILISTTEHPDYPFLLLSNRDEYYARPTKGAHFRTLENGTQILAPLDLARTEHGTWIGVTTSGKIAVLVNYREEDNTRMYFPLWFTQNIILTSQ